MKQLSGLDSMFLNLETPDAPMHFGALSLLDLRRAPAGFGFDTVRARIAQRLHLLPGFRRRLVDLPLNLVPPLWLEDPDFRLDNHVRRIRLHPPGRDAQLAELVAQLFSQALPRQRPLWAFYYVEGLSRRRAACIYVIHHCCIDGVSGAELLGRLLDTAAAPPPLPAPDTHWDPDEPPQALARLLYTARLAWVRHRRFAALLRHTAPLAWGLGRKLLARGDKKPAADQLPQPPSLLHAAPRTRFNVVIDARRAYACRTLSLLRIKALKDALGITVNDALLVICAGALRQYLLRRGELPPRPLVAAVPISLRGDGGDGGAAGEGNRVTLLGAELPTHLADPLERVAAVSHSTGELKRSHRSPPAGLLRDWMELPTPALVARAARVYHDFVHSDRLKPPVNLLISNIPGPRQPLYLAGAPLLATYPVSIPYHGLALNITVLSYRDQLDVGLTACREAVPDLASLLDLMEQALAELEQAAGLGAARPGRRIRAGTPRRGKRGAAKPRRKHAQ